jgi:predicted nucleotidyltransferase
VSGPDDVLLGRAELERAFTALGERLARRGVVADVFIVGGAAMALAYDASRVTRDVDARFVPHGIVHEEAIQVAEELGLPRWWLNEQASIYISGKEDAGKRRVFDHRGLRVMAASPHHIFAMKALAARTRDIDDLRLLADIIGIESADEALQTCADFYPDEPVSQRSAAVLRELFDQPTGSST